MFTFRSEDLCVSGNRQDLSVLLLGRTVPRHTVGSHLKNHYSILQCSITVSVHRYSVNSQYFHRKLLLLLIRVVNVVHL
jgi:hypothetical protein